MEFPYFLSISPDLFSHLNRSRQAPSFAAWPSTERKKTKCFVNRREGGMWMSNFPMLLSYQYHFPGEVTTSFRNTCSSFRYYHSSCNSCKCSVTLRVSFGIFLTKFLPHFKYSKSLLLPSFFLPGRNPSCIQVR